MGAWAVAKAKAQFSELIVCAQEKGAQEITRNGKLVGLLVSPEDWNKRNHEPLQNTRTMSDFFRNSPLVGSGLDLRRSKSKQRKIVL